MAKFLFLLSLGSSLTLLLYPYAVAHAVGGIGHFVLTLLLWGIAIGFIQGLGFTPHARIWRVIFALPLGFVLIIGSWAYLFFTKTLV